MAMTTSHTTRRSKSSAQDERASKQWHRWVSSRSLSPWPHLTTALTLSEEAFLYVSFTHALNTVVSTRLNSTAANGTTSASASSLAPSTIGQVTLQTALDTSPSPGAALPDAK